MSSFRKVGIGAAVAALTTLAVVPAFVVGTASATSASAAHQPISTAAAAGLATLPSKPLASADTRVSILGSSVPPAALITPLSPKKRCSVNKGPVHFRTPEATMRYLAAAWNCGDLRALRHVTTPASRTQLQWMHTEATNLQLVSCTDYGIPGHHSYSCKFTHDYPRGVAHDTPTATGKGQAWLTVHPARSPGWYVKEDSCG